MTRPGPMVGDTCDQVVFGRALLDPAAPVPDGLLDGDGRPAGRRFAVYRNNVAVSLTQALHRAFPTVARLLGPENMDGLAGLFLRAHPPESPLMMHYGQAMPGFIAGLAQLDRYGYLPDIARVDLAMRRSYHAADSTPLDPAALASLPPDVLMDARLGLAPSVQLIRSAWPIHDIHARAHDSAAPAPRPGPQDIVILRPEFDPAPHLLPPGGGPFLAALQVGDTLAGAQAAAETTSPGFDAGPIVALLLQGAALTHVTAKDDLT